MSKVSKIILEVGSKEIELSIEEAKELKRILGDLFNVKEIQFIPPSPIIIERYNRWHYQPYEIWCGYQTNDAVYLSNTTTTK